MTKINDNLISQSEAARIADVTRSAIFNIKKSGSWNFFAGSKVDTSHPDWEKYLLTRSARGIVKKNNNNNSTIKSKTDKRTAKEQKKIIKQTKKQDDALTGGYNLDNYIPTNIADVKRMTEIQKLKIEMEYRLSQLIDRDIVISIMDEMSSRIQSHFIDMPRSVSSTICKKLDRIGMEKQVEKILSEKIAKGIKEVKKIPEKMKKKKNRVGNL